MVEFILCICRWLLWLEDCWVRIWIFKIFWCVLKRDDVFVKGLLLVRGMNFFWVLIICRLRCGLWCMYLGINFLLMFFSWVRIFILWWYYMYLVLFLRMLVWCNVLRLRLWIMDWFMDWVFMGYLISLRLVWVRLKNLWLIILVGLERYMSILKKLLIRCVVRDILRFFWDVVVIFLILF